MSAFDKAWGVVKRDPRRPWLSGRRPENIVNPSELIHDSVVADEILNRPKADEEKAKWTILLL